MMKHYLMAPGPSMIPEKVLLKMAEPIIHHRTKQFEALILKIRKQLKEVFQTQNEVVILSSVGSGAMEAAVVNCFSEGDKVLVVRSGKFGERWSEQAKKYKLNVIDLDVEWGKAVQISEVEKILSKEKDVRGVLCQASETSTGTAHPIKELGILVKKHSETILLIDGITAMGTYDIKTDDWGLDVVVTGSQKAFMLPPGLAMASFSKKALSRMKESNLPKYYFNVLEEIKMLEKNQTHFTPAISLIQGLGVALDMMLEETLPKLFARHKRLAHATRSGVQALGLKLFSNSPSDSITAVICPEGIDGERVVEQMFKKYGYTIIGGQDKVKGKIFRIGHMGYCGDFDTLGVLSALEMTLKDMGHKFEWGVSNKAAISILHQGIGS